MRFAAVILALALCGCASANEASFMDRPWIDDGCDSAGDCRLRGELTILRGFPHSGGELRLDDGTCLPVALSDLVIARHDKWSGRRVSIRGLLMSRGAETPDIVSINYRDRWIPAGLCGPGENVLYAQRLSLKANR